MPLLPKPTTNQGMFVPTSVIYDSQRIFEADVNSNDFKQLIVRLYQSINILSLAINAREVGTYSTDEFVIGNLYYNPDPAHISNLRPIFRKTFNTGALVPGPNPGIPHGLTFTTSWQPVHIYGVACDTVNKVYWPMPNSDITVEVNATDIVISNWSGVIFDVSSMVLEYSKT